ncbi:MAG TPA: T9SS type A sorting domain-containing protein, partial [Saprospiraceae bacterium]|nr:T9SS type A sorting domain-containing protein [Saprospiraceae bacterium]
LQIIKVHDTDKPVIMVTIGDCEPAMKNPANQICYGHIDLTVDATDNCSPLDWLFYDYKIDLYNDGVGQHGGFDFAVGPLTRKEYAQGRPPVKHHNPLAEDENNPFDASGSYPIGVHKICWYVEDGCGNLAANCQLFEIKDCKAPTPYCHIGVVTTVMPLSGCITIWAKDLDAGSYDNCSEPEDLHIYFGDINSDSLTICCEDFIASKVNDELIIPVRVCVEDEEGNKDCCETTVVVQDPNDVCPDVGTLGRISGVVKTMLDQNTQHVELELFEQSQKLNDDLTKQDGRYLFGDLSFGVNKEYIVRPNRRDEPTNGVSTADIVMIQRHILGIEALRSPYQYIAADVNNTANITAADISEIRKLILGVIGEFSKNDSWTFVPKDYFMDVRNPWNAPREVKVQMPLAEHHLEDFVSIKMGDVSMNARSHDLASMDTRTKGVLHFEIESGYTTAGEVYRMDFRSSDFKRISGFQFTLKFDERLVQFERVEGGVLTLDESNIGTNRIDQGILTTSWNTNQELSLNAEAILFSIYFRAGASAQTVNLIGLTNEVTACEAYDSKLNILELKIGLRTNNGFEESGVFELYQNTPNPFGQETVIHYRLPNPGPIRLSLYDMAGKILRVYELEGKKGLNEIKIRKSDLQECSGVLYYQMDHESGSKTRKMFLVD